MNRTELGPLADEIELSLWRDLLDPWFPACVDSMGGFWQVYDARWMRKPSTSRGVVFQSRMSWVGAAVAMQGGDRAEEFAQVARHGAEYLERVFVEPETGAVTWMVDISDKPRPEGSQKGHTYGGAFTLYALAAAHRALGDAAPLDAAKKVFGWLEKCVHDSSNGGYFECCDVSGAPLLKAPDRRGEKLGDDIGTPYGQKSQNTHLHLMEAFAELAKSWRDPLLLERLAEVKEILEDKLYDPAGWLHIYAKPDWTPVPDRVSYGHDIEAAHLLIDAAETLTGSVDPKTAQRAISLADNTLLYGMDLEFGGFYTNGTAGGRPLLRAKGWWTQAEALYGLTRISLLPDAPTDDYLEAAVATWKWIKEHQIDSENRGWFEMIQQDGSPADPADHKDRKGHMWKAAYHEARALMETAKIFRALSVEE